jgi:hypothetical protein
MLRWHSDLVDLNGNLCGEGDLEGNKHEGARDGKIVLETVD